MRQLAGYLGPDESAPLCQDAAAVFLDQLKGTREQYALNTLLSGLYDVIAPLPPASAVRLRGQALLALTTIVTRDAVFANIEDLAPVLTRATGEVPPEDVARAFATWYPILAIVNGSGVSTAGFGLQQTLEGLIGQLPPEVADREAWDIIDRWTNTPRFLGGLIIPNVKLDINGKIDPATEDPTGRRMLAERAVFDRLAARMTPEGAARCAEPVLNKLSRWPDVEGAMDLARALHALSDRLPPEKADNLRTRASKLLRDKLAVVNTPEQSQAIGEMFTVLIERLTPEEAAAVCRALRQKMAQPRGSHPDGAGRAGQASARHPLPL